MDKTQTLIEELKETSLAIQRKRSQINQNNKKLEGHLSPLELSNTEISNLVMDKQITTLKLEAVTTQLKLSIKISEL